MTPMVPIDLMRGGVVVSVYNWGWRRSRSRSSRCFSITLKHPGARVPGTTLLGGGTHVVPSFKYLWLLGFWGKPLTHLVHPHLHSRQG